MSGMLVGEKRGSTRRTVLRRRVLTGLMWAEELVEGPVDGVDAGYAEVVVAQAVADSSTDVGRRTPGATSRGVLVL